MFDGLVAHMNNSIKIDRATEFTKAGDTTMAVNNQEINRELCNLPRRLHRSNAAVTR